MSLFWNAKHIELVKAYARARYRHKDQRKAQRKLQDFVTRKLIEETTKRKRAA